MKRKLKKLSLVLGLILMASFTIGISKVNAAETKAIKFESRCVMEAIKNCLIPRITDDDLIDLENLTLNLTQEQIDSVDVFWLGNGYGFSINNIIQYVEAEKNTVNIEGVEYKKISLKGIENFKNIKSVYFRSSADTKKIQIDLSKLKGLDIDSIYLGYDCFAFYNVDVLGKFPNLSSLSFWGYSYNKENQTEIKSSLDVSKVFPLDTKKEKVTINAFGCTLSDEEEFWNYISSNQDKKFELQMIDCGLTYVPSLKNIVCISFAENNIKSVSELSNVNLSTGVYDCKQDLWGYLGGYPYLLRWGLR